MLILEKRSRLVMVFPLQSARTAKVTSSSDSRFRAAVWAASMDAITGSLAARSRIRWDSCCHASVDRRRSSQLLATCRNRRLRTDNFPLRFYVYERTGWADEVGRLDAVFVGQLDQRPVQQDEVIWMISGCRHVVVRLGLARVPQVTEPGKGDLAELRVDAGHERVVHCVEIASYAMNSASPRFRVPVMHSRTVAVPISSPNRPGNAGRHWEPADDSDGDVGVVRMGDPPQLMAAGLPDSLEGWGLLIRLGPEVVVPTSITDGVQPAAGGPVLDRVVGGIPALPIT
jgi:hypothetical protein